jgi:hypothetical protein
MNTILSARYANKDNSAIVISTEENGDVAISERDTPDLWVACMEWRDQGNEIAEHVPVVFAPPRDLLAEIDALKHLIIQNGVASESDVALATKAQEN